MSNNLTLFILLASRFCGFFLLSPLFSGRAIPKNIRCGLSLACTLLLAPPLLSQHTPILEEPLLLSLQVIKELAIGYLLGFIFSLIFEAAAFAGQVVGTLMGLSATELLDPLSSQQHPLMARLFSLFLFTLFVSLDLHHPLLRLLYESFQTLPVNSYPFSFETIRGVIEASGLLFHQALSFAIFPLTVLLSLIALFALISRFFPVFWIGFPLQVFIGLIAVSTGIAFFAPLLENAFYKTLEIVMNSIVN